jgi:chitin disaccharide deacetylase
MTERRPRLLVVNADDFGLTSGVSRGIARASEEGVVTSTSILAVGTAFELAASLARSAPGLGLGAHLALVGEDRPLLSAEEVPTLVDRAGRFPLSWRTVVRRLALGRVDPGDMRRELDAQLQRILDIGVPVTHVDSHQHLHLWPAVGAVVLDLARENGIGAVRRPRSHRWIGVGAGVNLLSAMLGRRIRTAGLRATDDYAGLDEAGGLDADALGAALGAMAVRGSGTAEINAHPGEASDADLARFAWGYRWADELDALVAPATRAHIDRLGYRLGTFADLGDRELT